MANFRVIYNNGVKGIEFKCDKVERDGHCGDKYRLYNVSWYVETNVAFIPVSEVLKIENVEQKIAARNLAPFRVVYSGGAADDTIHASKLLRDKCGDYRFLGKATWARTPVVVIIPASQVAKVERVGG